MDVTSYLLGKKAGGGTPAVLEDKEVTINSNGETTITPSTGYTGISSVDLTVNVPQPSGSINITENGNNIDINDYSTANVNVQPDLETKQIEITENTTTTITPTQGKDGLSSVEVITNVSGGGGGGDFIYPELTNIYDSSCINNDSTTTLTTSVNAIKDNIVYAIVCARKTLTVDNTWTLLKTEKCYNVGVTQTTYVYYKKASSSGSISFTATQASSERMYLSLFAMRDSYKPSSTFKSAEISHPSGTNKSTITGINLVKGDILILSAVNISDTSNTYTIYCPSKRYAINSNQRLTVFRIEDNCTDLTIQHDSANLSGTFSYIVMTPQIGTSNSDLLVEASFNNCYNDSFGSQNTMIITSIPNKLKKLSTLTSISSRFTKTNFPNLRSVNFDEFDTSNVTNMSNAFNGTGISKLDLSNFITTNVTNMSYMFAYTDSSGYPEHDLQYIDFRNATIKSTGNYTHMFENCRSLIFLDIRNMDLTLLSSQPDSMFAFNKSGGSPTTTIIVKDNACKQWYTNNCNTTNVTLKTVAEYEGS